MPRRKTTAVRSQRARAAKETRVDRAKNVLSQIKWGESYTSLFLGAVVVVIALVLVFGFIKGRTTLNKEVAQSTATETQQGKSLPKTYTVKEGDDLWTISQKVYGSGYNWTDLASANKLQNPGTIFVGTKLVVPSVTPKIVVTVTPAPTGNAITGSTYTIQRGDSLWDIAVRAYGDGYKWVEIARANSLSNPDLIHADNVLKLPR